jgi:hypothetical protein
MKHTAILLISSSAVTSTPASNANSHVHVHGLRPTILSRVSQRREKSERSEKMKEKGSEQFFSNVLLCELGPGRGRMVVRF